MQGQRPKGDWREGPSNFEVGGGGPCIRPPNILRSSVVGCARKYEHKKGVIKELFSEIEVVLMGKERKNPKNLVND